MAELYQNILEWALPPGDTAQTSVWWLVGDTATPATVLTEFTSDFVDVVWPSSSGGIKGEFPNGVTLQRLMTRQINVSTGETIGVAEALISRNGTGSGTPLPPECSPCLSLRTAVAGPSGRGRVYLPPTIVGALSAVGGIESGHATTLADGWADGLISLNANTTFTLSTVGVYSRKLHAVNAVTAVRCGTTFDAQRRRRNAASEVYVTIPV